jgi:hypothetical protein
MKELKKATQKQLDDLWYDGYGEYIFNNADTDYCVISNGDTLLEQMERGYLWEEFLASKGLTEA